MTPVEPPVAKRLPSALKAARFTSLSQGLPGGRITAGLMWSLCQSRVRTGRPLPSLHSDDFYPVPEPSIKTGVLALTMEALELLGR